MSGAFFGNLKEKLLTELINNFEAQKVRHEFIYGTYDRCGSYCKTVEEWDALKKEIHIAKSCV